MEHLLFPSSPLNSERLTAAVSAKHVLITGASYGIGEQAALLLAAHGAHVILVARTTEKLQQLKATIEKDGGRATVLAADLYQAGQVDTLNEQLQQITGGIHLFINNAGKSIKRAIADSLERNHDFTRTITLNYTSPVQLCLGLIPSLKQNKGQIINVSSAVCLLLPVPYWAAYHASKTAFDTWLRAAAPELKEMNIATTTLYLPLVRTRMIAPTKEYEHAPAMSPQHVARIIGRAAYQRNTRYMPWWLIFAQTTAFLFRRVWERFAINLLKR